MKKVLMGLLLPFVMLFSFPSFALDVLVGYSDIPQLLSVTPRMELVRPPEDVAKPEDNMKFEPIAGAAAAPDQAEDPESDGDTETLPAAALIEGRLFWRDRIPILDG